VPPPLDLPAHWWGPFGRRSTVLSIQDLIANRTISVDLAAWLWLLIEAGASTLVCAGPGGAGKTTLLTALTAFIGPNRAPYVVRGAYDPLDAIAGRPPAETVLLLNEISAHLPIYVWGPGARRVFEAGLAGAQLLGTAHAITPGGAAWELTAPPVHASDSDLRLWDLVVFIEAWWQGDQVMRQVAGVTSFSLEWPAAVLATRSADGIAWPNPSQTLRVARRLGREDATIEDEVRRRVAALNLVP
jgi:energy-coupling factor transporter ATP-binding protein EcfA2